MQLEGNLVKALHIAGGNALRVFSLGQHSVEMSVYACTDLSLISEKDLGKAKQGQQREKDGKIKVKWSEACV